MDFDEFASQVDEIQKEYETLMRKLETTNNPDALEILEAENNRLADKLIALFVLYVGVAGAEAFAQGVSNAGGGGVPSSVEAAAIKFHETKVLRTVSTARSLKLDIGRDILITKEDFTSQIEEAVSKASRGVLGQQSARENVSEINDIFNERIKQLRTENDYMFLIRARKAGTDDQFTLRRVQAKSYAKLIDNQVRGQIRMEAEVDQYKGAGIDILRVPVNAGTQDACIDFEGKLLSISGDNVGKRVRTDKGVEIVEYSLSQLQSRETHLLHPFCKHREFRTVKVLEILS